MKVVRLSEVLPAYLKVNDKICLQEDATYMTGTVVYVGANHVEVFRPYISEGKLESERMTYFLDSNNPVGVWIERLVS